MVCAAKLSPEASCSMASVPSLVRASSGLAKWSWESWVEFRCNITSFVAWFWPLFDLAACSAVVASLLPAELVISLETISKNLWVQSHTITFLTSVTKIKANQSTLTCNSCAFWGSIHQDFLYISSYLARDSSGHWSSLSSALSFNVELSKIVLKMTMHNFFQFVEQSKALPFVYFTGFFFSG